MCNGIPKEAWHSDDEGPGACCHRQASERYVQLQGKDSMGAKLKMQEGNGHLSAPKGGRYQASHTNGRRSWTNATGKTCVCAYVFCHLVNSSACKQARASSETEGARRHVRPAAYVEPGVRSSIETMVPNAHRGDGQGTVCSLCPVSPARPRWDCQQSVRLTFSRMIQKRKRGVRNSKIPVSSRPIATTARIAASFLASELTWLTRPTETS